NQLRHQLEREMALEAINRKKRPPRGTSATDHPPPGDETAGATSAADSRVSGAGNTACDSLSAAASAESLTSVTPPSTPDARTKEIDRVADGEETTKESTTTNS